jgi:hypothetical protein
MMGHFLSRLPPILAQYFCFLFFGSNFNMGLTLINPNYSCCIIQLIFNLFSFVDLNSIFHFLMQFLLSHIQATLGFILSE